MNQELLKDFKKEQELEMKERKGNGSRSNYYNPRIQQDDSDDYNYEWKRAA